MIASAAATRRGGGLFWSGWSSNCILGEGMNRLHRDPPGHCISLLYEHEELPPYLRIEMRGSCGECLSQWLLKTGDESRIKKTLWTHPDRTSRRCERMMTIAGEETITRACSAVGVGG